MGPSGSKNFKRLHLPQIALNFSKRLNFLLNGPYKSSFGVMGKYSVYTGYCWQLLFKVSLRSFRVFPIFEHSPHIWTDDEQRPQLTN